MNPKKIVFFFFILTLFNQQAFAQSKPLPKLKKEKKEEQESGPVKIENVSPKQLATNGFADMVEEVMPAVVNISAIQEGGSPASEDFKELLDNQFRNQQGQKKKFSSIGSGFVISRDGFIVTNSHVVEDTDEIIVSINESEKYKAKLIGVDKKTDLALLKINVDRDLKFAKFGDSNKSRIGDWIIVVGNPYGLGGSVSVGIISARGRDINNGQSDEFIQTDAAINKGNSGGPMFNVKGEVIAISTAIFSPSGGSVGIGFGTPSSVASQVIKQLKEQGEVTRGWIGVSVQDVTEEIAESMKIDKARGAFVNDVTKDGPAEKGGILPTDIIIKIDDQEINEMKILPKTVAKYPIGKVAKITVLRRDKIKVLKIKIAKMKEDEVKKTETRQLEKKLGKPTAQILGLSLAELSAKIKNGKNIDSNIKGLIIVDVAIKSEAAEKGVMAGDIILSANQSPVASIDDLKEIVEEAKKSSTKKLFLFIKRGGNNYPVALIAK